MSIDTYFCFCCLSTNELSSLFSSNSNTNHVLLLKELFSVKPSQDYEDDSYICAECAVRLKEAYTFKQQVFDTINILQVNGLVELRKLKGDLVITKVFSGNPDLEAKDGVKNDTKCDLEIVLDEELTQDLKLQQSDLKEIKKEPMETKNVETGKILYSTEKIQPVILGTENQLSRKREKGEKESCVVAEDLKCDVCRETLPNAYVYHRHMNEHFPNHICEMCGKGFITEKRLKRHMTSHDTGPFKCQSCDAVFTNYSTFNAHRQRKHSTQHQYGCPHCPDRFRTYARRALHLTAAHAHQARRYPCAACGKTFLLAGNLSQHMRSQHLKVKRYSCKLCDAGFFQNQDLVSHMSAHSGENQFRCTVCNKSYPRKKSFKVHMLTHLDEKPFGCDACDKTFAQKCALLSHMKTHSTLEKKRRTTMRNSSKNLESRLTYKEVIVPKMTYSEEIIPKVTYSEEIIPKVTYSEEIIPKMTYSEDISSKVTCTEVISPIVTNLQNLSPKISNKEDASPKLTKLVPKFTKLVETNQPKAANSMGLQKMTKVDDSDKMLYNCYKLFY